MILDEGLLESATIFRAQHQSMSLQRNSQDGSPDPSVQGTPGLDESGDPSYGNALRLETIQNKTPFANRNSHRTGLHSFAIVVNSSPRSR